MQRSLALMQAALRVLRDCPEKRQPSTQDIDELTRLYGHKPYGVGFDERACGAIERALKDRAKLRGNRENRATVGAG
jgi:hypothetical protein